MPRRQQTYDHRLREAVRSTGDLTIATNRGVPRSTAAGWLKAPRRQVVTMDALSMDQPELLAEVLRLRRRIRKLRAVIALLVAVLRTLKVDLRAQRIPAVLLDAGRSSSAGEEPPKLIADGGGENVNGRVDELIESGLLQRLIAMTDLCFSNSMIEAWWRTLKHQWLFLHTLDSVEKVRKLVEFYVAEHNQVLPHSAFRGQTPDEMYSGAGDDIPHELAAYRRAARLNRLEVNRELSCLVCEPADDKNAA